jgi:hypothetical protein
VLNRYAEENNYATVLDSSAQNSPVLYASKNIDLTQDIIRLYDKAYPAKAAAPASKHAPSAPKPPATPTATKPQWVLSTRSESRRPQSLVAEGSWKPSTLSPARWNGLWSAARTVALK